MKNATIIENEPEGWKRAFLLVAEDGREIGAFCFRDSAEAYAEKYGYTLTSGPVAAYRDMPLSEVMASQRERLFARHTYYTERGHYSALVVKETGLRGAFWHICVRIGSRVLLTDIHYAGPDHAQRRADEMLCKVAGPAPVADEAAPLCVPGKPLPAAFIVFTVFNLLPSSRPELAAYEFRKVPDGATFPGAVYPVHRAGALASWVGEPCATLADAERAAFAHAGLCASCGHDLENVNFGCRDCL